MNMQQKKGIVTSPQHEHAAKKGNARWIIKSATPRWLMSCGPDILHAAIHSIGQGFLDAKYLNLAKFFS
jgi:hypothetical protein